MFLEVLHLLERGVRFCALHELVRFGALHERVRFFAVHERQRFFVLHRVWGFFALHELVREANQDKSVYVILLHAHNKACCRALGGCGFLYACSNKAWVCVLYTSLCAQLIGATLRPEICLLSEICPMGYHPPPPKIQRKVVL